MRNRDAYKTYEMKANGQEETCLWLRHENSDLSAGDIEYIQDALEEMTEALSVVIKIKAAK